MSRALQVAVFLNMTLSSFFSQSDSENTGVEWRIIVLYINNNLHTTLHGSLSIAVFSSVKHNGDLTMEQIIEIARTMRPRSMARSLSGRWLFPF